MEFNKVPVDISFAKAEEEVQQLWLKLDAFQTSLKMSKGKPPFLFYDGPPFATGLPHYGNLLTGIIKDIVTRYAHQTGHYVSRRFGWDCHGLPIEFEIEKMLGIKTQAQVLDFGIDKYNDECRKIVMRYAKEWEVLVKRSGRWIDFENDYKTLDMDFMESVWWVFKSLWSKGYVYRAFKVLPFSTGCGTPLSNFEASSNYKDTSDPSVVVSFPLISEPEVSIIAWTTTPWTLPSNMAVCVNPDFDYIKIKDNASGRQYILMEKRLVGLYDKPDPSQYVVLAKYKGKDLEGLKYEPLFPYFVEKIGKTSFRVVVDTYVSDANGTGVVHQSPGFGEDDYRICLAAGVFEPSTLVCPVDVNGFFTPDVLDFAGQHVKAADPNIIKLLKSHGRIVKHGNIVHSYPFCWRSETPLIYKAVATWFIKVEESRDKLLANCDQQTWVPAFVGEKRFANWLKDARDWAVSRNRFWGTPLPVWVSDDGEEVVVVGSVEELRTLTGAATITDIHRDKIDHLTIPSKKGKGVLRRVPEVFDCWFESGSMPYGQLHYPFENKEIFEASFPADFIAEGLDQTRGWFYTLLVISTLLFDKPAFKNVIVNGLVLAADGKKMSKRLKNYPDPFVVFNELGADAVRLYMVTSPVVRAETLKFEIKAVKDIIRNVFLPWFNAYRFFVENVKNFTSRTGVEVHPSHAYKSDNVMDKWILGVANNVVKFVRAEMKAYHLYSVTPELVKFINQLTNWFVRLNRKRVKGEGVDQASTHYALSTLYEVLLVITTVLAPFTPHFTEYLYQNLRKGLPKDQQLDSVHYVMIPEPHAESVDPVIQASVADMQNVIQLVRYIRDRRNIPMKVPLKTITIINKDPNFHSSMKILQRYIQEEINVRNIELSSSDDSVLLVPTPNLKRLGPVVGKALPAVKDAISKLSQDQLHAFLDSGKVEVLGHALVTDDITITRSVASKGANLDAEESGGVLVLVDITVDQAMKEEGLIREIAAHVQKLRKKAGLSTTDEVQVSYQVEGAGSDLHEKFARNDKLVLSLLKRMPQSANVVGTAALPQEVGRNNVIIDKYNLWLVVANLKL